MVGLTRIAPEQNLGRETDRTAPVPMDYDIGIMYWIIFSTIQPYPSLSVYLE
jgi:hypothetical protein